MIYPWLLKILLPFFPLLSHPIQFIILLYKKSNNEIQVKMPIKQKAIEYRDEGSNTDIGVE